MVFTRFRYSLSLLFFMAISIALSVPALAGGHGAHWGYEGEAGPGHWGDLNPEYRACKEGSSQSPVDISGTVDTELGAVSVDYKDTPLRIINNGHAIQADYQGGSSITVAGKRYGLLQFHFHGPSENTVSGKPYDMEAHLVHKSADGALAVIAVFMKEGAENALIKTLWDNLPAEEGKAKEAGGVTVNAGDLLPGDMGYYNFTGSLTTPPCTEGVNWLVLKSPVEVSREQIKTFSSIFPVNARPVQPLNGRVIKAGK